ncbi:hypothetical protein KAW38_02660 [Candidatus Micrarchaeota archaeon]|nr:hypothetical protein [Candidatus Micrarchaeota archaeon]
MAKPIRATPTLRGEDAIKFVKETIKEEETPSKNRVRTILRARRNFSYFEQFIS